MNNTFYTLSKHLFTATNSFAMTTNDGIMMTDDCTMAPVYFDTMTNNCVMATRSFGMMTDDCAAMPGRFDAMMKRFAAALNPNLAVLNRP